MNVFFKPVSPVFLILGAGLMLLAGCSSTNSARPAPIAAVPDPGPLVWCGLDYSLVKMIGTRDFRQPDEIFPQMPFEWNDMFMKEMYPWLQRNNKGKETTNDLGAVEERNRTISGQQIEKIDGTFDDEVKASDITPEQIASIVASYKLPEGKGTGAVIIMDRLVKKQEAVCAYVVFFDLETRKVLYSKRKISNASKGTFRTHWFKPIKAIAGELTRGLKVVPQARAEMASASSSGSK